MTARMAAAVDDLSGGRLVLGVGAGWQEREHNNYGWQLLDVPGRFARFEEGLLVINHLLRSEAALDFDGSFYRLREAVLLPRPQRAGGPPILIGGNGPRRTLPLVARYADQWNGLFINPAGYGELNRRLDGLLATAGREPSAVQRSLMTGCVFGRDQAELDGKLARRGRTASELHDRGIAAGTGAQIGSQLEAWAAAGVQCIMLQWLDLDDLDGLEALAAAVLEA
jgi:alkanesulfonate monooxygenase SsuD/methylene tetrahydromethanopterin reductase-like flavin-dependent oxidoreductase (luciferase family)